jgi:hypothetical protein
MPKREVWNVRLHKCIATSLVSPSGVLPVPSGICASGGGGAVGQGAPGSECVLACFCVCMRACVIACTVCILGAELQYQLEHYHPERH